jgi:hypothetical protein
MTNAFTRRSVGCILIRSHRKGRRCTTRYPNLSKTGSWLSEGTFTDSLSFNIRRKERQRRLQTFYQDWGTKSAKV